MRIILCFNTVPFPFPFLLLSYFCRYEDFKHYILTAFKNTCVYDETLVNFMKKQRYVLHVYVVCEEFVSGY